MFKDKYTKDVEKIKFEGSLKRYVKAKMRQEKSAKKSSLRFVGVLAGMVCACIIASLLYTPENPSSVVTPLVEKKDKVLLSGIKYAEIYDAITLARENYAFINESETLLGDSGVTTGTASKPADKGEPGTETNGSSSEKPTHSTTNNQVVDVDETDIVKTDGEYIYVCKSDSVHIVKAIDGKLEYVALIDVDENYKYTAEGIFISDNKLAVILSDFLAQNTVIRAYDLTDKANPQLIGEKAQSGFYFNSRMVNGTVYLMTKYNVGNDINKDKPETYVPSIDGATIKESGITSINNFTSCSYLVVSAFNVNEAKITSTKAFLGGAENIYCDNDSLYFTFTKSENGRYNEKTYIVKVALVSSDIKIQAMGEVKGRPLNQFSMDEYNGNLRIVTTVLETKEVPVPMPVTSGEDAVSSTSETYTAFVGKYSALYVLDKNLKVIGKIENLAPNEQVYSVRFDGNIGYFVTFKQIDPLFTVDLKDPTNPTVLSELKIPGFSEYLHPFGEGKLFGFGKNTNEFGNEIGLKMSMFDVSDPTNVTEEKVLKIESSYSEASSNHKAIMVDTDKNLIVFVAADNRGYQKVYVYGYDTENGFYERKIINVGGKSLKNARFVWIEDHFYLVHNSGIFSFDLENFNEVSKIDF